MTMSFDPTVSLGNLLQLTALVVGFVSAWVRLSTRLTAIEVEQKLAAQARETHLTSLSALSAQVAILTRQVAQLEGRMAGQQK